MTKFAYFRGEIIPLAEAKLGIMNNTLNYGTGVFEGMRAYWNDRDEQMYIFRMREHYERLAKSCRIMMLNLPMSVPELCDLTVEVVRRNEPREDTYIRPLAYKESDLVRLRLDDIPDGFFIYTTPFGKYLPQEQGIRCTISTWRRLDDNALPARAKVVGAYANSALIKSQAALDGYDEAIVLTHDGHVSEGSSENVFLVTGGKLVTPTVTDNILVGITRNTIIELAREELGIDVVERQIGRTELYTADEAFLTGSAAEVTPVGEIEHRKVGDGNPGPVTMRLQELYLRAVRGQLERHQDWITPVYPRG